MTPDEVAAFLDRLTQLCDDCGISSVTGNGGVSLEMLVVPGCDYEERRYWLTGVEG